MSPCFGCSLSARLFRACCCECARHLPRGNKAKSILFLPHQSASFGHYYSGCAPVPLLQRAHSKSFNPLTYCVRLRHDSRWTKLNELEAEVGRTEALYAAVTEEGRVAEEESSSLTAVRTRLEREMVQIGA